MKTENPLICEYAGECKRWEGVFCHHDHPHVLQADCNSPCLVHGTKKVSACCVILGIVIVRHEERLDE